MIRLGNLLRVRERLGKNLGRDCLPLSTTYRSSLRDGQPSGQARGKPRIGAAGNRGVGIRLADYQIGRRARGRAQFGPFNQIGIEIGWGQPFERRWRRAGGRPGAMVTEFSAT